MVEVGRHLWVHLVHPMLEQGHPELVAQERFGEHSK